MSRLSPHFTLDELISSQTATRRGIDNYPSHEVYSNLVNLAELLEKVRLYLGNVPIHINSGYRSKELNAVIGGAQNSAHMVGRAADFTHPDFSPYTVVKMLADSGIPFDKVINEFNRWVHIQVAEKGSEPRRQVFMAVQTPQGTIYTQGLK